MVQGAGTGLSQRSSGTDGTGAGTGTSGIDQTLAAGYAGTGLSQRSSGTDGTGMVVMLVGLAGIKGTDGTDQTLAGLCWYRVKLWLLVMLVQG